MADEKGIKIGDLVEVSESNLMTGCFRAEWEGRVVNFLTMPINMLDGEEEMPSRFGVRIEDAEDHKKKVYDRLITRVRLLRKVSQP